MSTTPIASVSTGDPIEADHINLMATGINDIAAALPNCAPLDSPPLTGTPTAPTADPGTGGTQVATCAYVETAVATGGGGAAPIEEIVLSASASSVSFSSIPDTYRHLRIEYIARTDLTSGPSGSFDMRFNDDSTAGHYSAVASYRSVNHTNGEAGSRSDDKILAIGSAPGAYGDIPAGHSGQGTIHVPYYCATTPFYRRANAVSGQHGRTGFDSEVLVMTSSGSWFSTSSITKVTLFNSSGANFIAGCRFALYGEV